MQNELDIVRDVSARLDRGGIGYMLTGSMAMNYYAQPRMTRDIDVVVVLEVGDARRVVQLFGDDYYVAPESLSENCEGCCGGGFWFGARRSGQSIPAAGCDARDNEAPSQKTRRPEGLRAEGRLASLLLSRRPMKGILLRRASPASLLPANSTPRNFQTGSEAVESSIARYSLFNLIHHESVIKVDCIVRKPTEYRLNEFERRQRIRIGDFETWIVSKEDLILSKLFWAKDSRSELQLRDVANLVSTGCDRGYIEHWTNALGVANLWLEIAHE